MKKKKILLIDDQEDFIMLMKERIEYWGYKFCSANSGALGIKALALKPDLVILDLIMPVMDGLTTLKKIREIDKDIPVFMLTSHEDFDVVKEAEKLGVTVFIFKLTIEPNLRTLLAGALKE